MPERSSQLAQQFFGHTPNKQSGLWYGHLYPRAALPENGGDRANMVSGAALGIVAAALFVLALIAA